MKQKQHADNCRKDVVPFLVGSSVLLSTKKITLATPGPSKLWPKFIGPFKVCKRIGDVAHRLELPTHLVIHDVFHVSLLRKLVPSKMDVPPPVPVDANIEYEIEKTPRFSDSESRLRYAPQISGQVGGLWT